MLPVWLMRPKQHRPTGLRSLALAWTGGLGYAFSAYWGFKFAPAAHAAVLLAGLMPFTIAGMAWMVLDERPGRSRWIGLGLTACGIASLSVDAFQAPPISLWGDAFFVAGSLSWSVYTVLLRRWSVEPLGGTAAVVLLSAALFLPVYALFLPKGVASASVGEILLQATYQGVLAAIVAMVFFIRGVAMLGASRMGMAMAMIPGIAGVGAALILGEGLTLWTSCGLAFVTLGAVASHSRPWWLKSAQAG